MMWKICLHALLFGSSLLYIPGCAWDQPGCWNQVAVCWLKINDFGQRVEVVVISGRIALYEFSSQSCCEATRGR